MALVLTPYCLVCDECGAEIAIPHRASRNAEALLLFAEVITKTHDRQHAKPKPIKAGRQGSRWSDLLKPFRDELNSIA